GDSRIAAVGPALVDGDGRPQIGSYGHLPSPVRRFTEFAGISALPGLGESGIWGRGVARPGAQTKEVGWLSGACLLVRLAAVRTCAALNEHYFMYAEDIEWCERFR